MTGMDDRPALRLILRYGEIRALLECPRVPAMRPVREFGIGKHGERIPIANRQWERGGSGPLNKAADPKAMDQYIRLRTMFNAAGVDVWPPGRRRNGQGLPIMGAALVDTWLDLYAPNVDGPWQALAAMIGHAHREQARREWERLLEAIERLTRERGR